MHNNDHLLEFAKKTAISAGKLLLNHFGNISSIETKSTNIDLVTIADLESEKMQEYRKRYITTSDVFDTMYFKSHETELNIFTGRQGGLLDVLFHNQYVYFTYSQLRDEVYGSTAIAKGELINNNIIIFKLIIK